MQWGEWGAAFFPSCQTNRKLRRQHENLWVNFASQPTRLELTSLKVRKNRQQKNVQLVLQHCCKTSWMAMLLVLPPTSNLSCNKSGCWQVWTWGVKRVISLFNSFCSNVARQVARFFVARFPYLKRVRVDASGNFIKNKNRFWIEVPSYFNPENTNPLCPYSFVPFNSLWRTHTIACFVTRRLFFLRGLMLSFAYWPLLLVCAHYKIHLVIVPSPFHASTVCSGLGPSRW